MTQGQRRITVSVEQEDDGRWIGEVEALPGCLVYGGTEVEAAVKAVVLAFRIEADPALASQPLTSDQAAAQARLADLFGRVDFAPGFDTDRGYWPGMELSRWPDRKG